MNYYEPTSELVEAVKNEAMERIEGMANLGRIIDAMEDDILNYRNKIQYFAGREMTLEEQEEMRDSCSVYTALEMGLELAYSQLEQFKQESEYLNNLTSDLNLEEQVREYTQEYVGE